MYMISETDSKIVLEIVNKYEPVILFKIEDKKFIIHTSSSAIDYMKFRKLKKELEEKGFFVIAKPYTFSSDYYYEIFRMKIDYTSSNLIPLLLFIVNSITVFLAGYFIFFKANISFALIYTFALLSILGIHELGHYLMARSYGLKVSLPFFIPGFPFGTFGAVIRLREPFVDRFQSFDVGISGPLLGLIPCVIYLILGINFSTFTNEINQDALQYVPFILQLIFSQYFPQNATVLLHPFAFAAFLGLIITFLNMTPVAQLDGGHVINSFLGNRNSLKLLAAFISIIVLIYTDFLAMAFLAIFLLFYRIEPLNMVSNVDKKRKIITALFLLIWILLAPWPLSSYKLSALK